MCIRSWCIQNHILWFVFFPHSPHIVFIYNILLYNIFFIYILLYLYTNHCVLFSTSNIQEIYTHKRRHTKWKMNETLLAFPNGCAYFLFYSTEKKCIYISYRKGIEPIFHIFLSIVLFSTKLSRYPSLKITHFILMKMRHCQLF